MHLVERQTKRGWKTKARPSWTAYGTGSWMTWSRYRKKWSWYFINIAPRWEALKLDRATMSNRWSRCLKPTTVKTVRWWNEAERAFPVLLSSLRSIEKREHQSFCLSATIKKRQTCGGQKKRVRSEIYFLRSLQFKYITNKRRWCEIFTERTFKYSFAWYLRSDLGKQWDKNASIDSSTSVVIIIISFKTSWNDHWSLSLHIHRNFTRNSTFYDPNQRIRSNQF